MKICPDCLSKYKRSSAGKLAKANGGAWGKHSWPIGVYHSQSTRKCLDHHVQAIVDCAKRRASLAKATPAWADKKEIKKIYHDCFVKTQETGIKHEVDHIIPLNGIDVKGLHIGSNLRIITATDNRYKGNKY